MFFRESLKSKVIVTVFKDPNTGADKPTPQRKIVAMTMDTKKVFMLTTSITSFANYGRLVAELKEKKITELWSHVVNMKCEKTENDKGKFQVVNFTLREELTAEDKIEMGDPPPKKIKTCLVISKPISSVC